MSEPREGKVVWHVSMSVDGFIAGPEHAMDWIFEHGGSIPMADEVMNATGAILAAAGGRNLEVFGADVNRQCVEAGLADELIVHLVPTLLGDGVRLYGEPATDPARLELIDTDRSGQIASLRYRFRD